MNKTIFKRSPDELQEYLKFKRKGFKVKNKKGKGSYTRKNQKVDFLKNI